MKNFAVIYATTCLKNTAYNKVGDYVFRVSCVFAEDVRDAHDKFIRRFRKSVKHNPVEVFKIIPVDLLYEILIFH